MTMNTRTAGVGDLQVVRDDPTDEPREAIGLLANARRVAEDTMARAQEEAGQLLASAREDVEQLEKEARAHADQQLATAEQESERVRYQAYGEAERLLADARGQVAEFERTAARLRSERAAAADSVRELAARLMQAVDTGPTGPTTAGG